MCCVEGARLELLVLLADAFAQVVAATLWIFLIGAADAGALLFSAQVDHMDLQPHRCQIKDWRYSLAASTVCDVFSRLILQDAVCCDDGVGLGMGGCVALRGRISSCWC
jgi:hypothetical protein